MVDLHIVDGDLERLRDQVGWVGEDLGGLETGVVGRVASGVPGARACGACAAASGAVGDWLSGLEGRYGAVSAGVRAMAAAYRADDDAQAGALAQAGAGLGAGAALGGGLVGTGVGESGPTGGPAPGQAPGAVEDSPGVSEAFERLRQRLG